MPILAILFPKPRKLAHKAQRGYVLGRKGARSKNKRAVKGSILEMQGDGFTSEPGGIMEVAMWLCASLLIGLCFILGLEPNYSVPVLGNLVIFSRQ